MQETDHCENAVKDYLITTALALKNVAVKATTRQEGSTMIHCQQQQHLSD